MLAARLVAAGGVKAGAVAMAGAAVMGLASCGGAAPPHGAASGPPRSPATAPPRSTTASARPPSPAAPLTTRPSASSPPPPGTSAITGRLAGVDWTYIPTTRHVVALTFDAGANADGIPSILATLRHDRIPATFFLTGNFAATFPAATRSIAAAGYRIGNHTLSHPYLTRLSDAAVRHEITGGAREISAVTGSNPAPLFRFPYGDANFRVIAIANQAGYVSVRWTVDTLGWEGTAGHISAAVVASRVLAALRPGEIVLMHVGSNPADHSTFDANALPRVISELRARGYSFVTLDALTG